MDFERCSEDCAHPTIVVEENKRKFTLQKPQREKVIKIKVDGCLIDDRRQRCDYIFEIGKSPHCAVYLELKGSDIDKAYRQLAATIGYLTERHQTCTKICHIVASRVPRAGPKVQNLKVQLARTHRAILFVGTQEVTIRISQPPYCNP